MIVHEDERSHKGRNRFQAESAVIPRSCSRSQYSSLSAEGHQPRHVKAYRKDVLAMLRRLIITRKKKLLKNRRKEEKRLSMSVTCGSSSGSIHASAEVWMKTMN